MLHYHMLLAKITVSLGHKVLKRHTVAGSKMTTQNRTFGLIFSLIFPLHALLPSDLS